MKEGRTFKKLGEVCEIYQPQTISTDMLVPDGKYLVYGANGVIGKYNEYNHTDSEVLLTCRGATCGSINVSEPFSWINGNAMVIHPINDSIFYSRSFLVYLMKSIDYSTVITGAAQPQITRQKLSPLMVAIPPLIEQQHIVSTFDLIQSIIDKQQSQLKELDKLTQSIFYDMFGDPVLNDKGWELKPICDVCSPKKDIRRATKTFDNDDDIMYIDISAIDNNKNVITTPTLLHFGSAPSRAQQVVVKDDVLISLVRPNLNNVAIVSMDNLNLVASSGFCVLRAARDLEPLFLFAIVKMKYFTDYLMQRVSGANYPAVREDDITEHKIITPPFSLQHLFAEKIETIEKQKANISKAIAEAQQLFDYTMDKYFG